MDLVDPGFMIRMNFLSDGLNVGELIEFFGILSSCI